MPKKSGIEILTQKTMDLEKISMAFKKVEQNLRETEEFNRGLLNHAPNPILVINPDTSISYVNPAFEKLTGYSFKELSKKKAPYPWWTKWTKHRTRKEFQNIINKGERRIEELFQKKNGDLFWVDILSTPVGSDKGFAYLISNWMDISERKQAEESLKESERRYRAVVEDMPAMVCRYLPDGELTFVNGAYCNFVNKKKEELIGRYFFNFFSDEEQKKVKTLISSLNKKKVIATSENMTKAREGDICWQIWFHRALFNADGDLVEYQSLGRDITETKLAEDEKDQLERQIRQIQKMESIGALARGIAHDFNNILWAITGNIEFAVLNLSNKKETKSSLKYALKLSDRAQKLIRQILTFSRNEESELKPIKLDIITKEAIKLLSSTLPASIKIKQNIDANAGLVNADPTQIYQVLMNLCTNADHAMRDQGGILEISLEKSNLKKRLKTWDTDLVPGQYVRLTVKDSGRGISPGNIDKVFDPYFSTKTKKEGTGLGLSVVHGIIKSHKGAITVKSSLGQGTLFTIYFPKNKKK